VALRALFKGQSDVLSTNALALGVVSIAAGTLAVVLLVQAVIGIFTAEVTVVAEENPPALLPGLHTSRYALPTVDAPTLNLALADTAAIVSTAEEEIIFANQTGVPLSAQELSTLLDLDLNPNLRQSLTSLRLVVTDTIQHGLVLEVDDPFTALGGMLEWEESMAGDLRELLFIPNRPLDSYSFTDDTYLDIDRRVLTDGSEELLVYGFVTDNIILITRTTATFERLAK
jgi:hypothetical protein